MTELNRPNRTRATSPTVLRWELAQRLRTLRQEAGRSIEEVAAELMCSSAKISRLETGGRGIQARDVRDLCRFYGVREPLRDELIRMANDAKRPGWWHDYRSLDEQTATFLGLETAASRIRTVETRVVVGLLQTADYTSLLLSGMLVPQADPDLVRDMAEIRQRRRTRVDDGSVELHVVMDEAAIMRDFGRPDIMAGQLDRLIDAATLGNVTIQIVPFNASPYPGIEGSFIHMEFDNRVVSDLVYVEGLLGKFLVDREADVERYASAFHQSSQRALSAGESLGWLQRQRERQLTNPRGNSTNKKSWDSADERSLT